MGRVSSRVSVVGAPAESRKGASQPDVWRQTDTSLAT